MPPAPRPIAPSRRPGAPPTSSRQPQTEALPSSLDLLFSYSRSAGFYGENLAHSRPSFVEEYRRPGDVEGGGAGGGTTTEDSARETTTDAETEGEGGGWSEEEALAEGDEDDGRTMPWAFLPPSSSSPAARLPPNAVASSSREPTPRPAAEASERTPLLPPPAGNARLSPAGEGRAGARRPSTFSKEEWKKRVEETRGESSWGQTLFNTINVLIGVGLLADPLAFADSGWLLGCSLLVFCSGVTYYTALLLSRLMTLHPTSQTYADVLTLAYGPRLRPLIYGLFLLELGTFSVAAVELFADSFAGLYPSVSAAWWKLIACGILLPTTFLPLRLLSLTSLLGILSSLILLVVLVSDGAYKPAAPGSLRDVMPTSIGPRWERLPISFGLFMSGFSGHAVVPSLYRDMKNPRHFPSMAAVAFATAFVVSLVFGVLGYLMFGPLTLPSITQNLAALSSSYPPYTTRLAIYLVGLNPLFKYAIANKPLVQTFEALVGLGGAPTPAPTPAHAPSASSHLHLDSSAIASSSAASLSPNRAAHLSTTAAAAERRRKWIRYTLLRPSTTFLSIAAALLIPEFDRVLAFLGSASAFVICVILPVGAYLLSAAPAKKKEGKGAARGAEERARSAVVAQARAVREEELARLRREAGEPEEGKKLEISVREKMLCWALLVMSTGLAVTGTVWSFLPVEEAGDGWKDFLGGRGAW
ncbi:hypothetical protein JCM10213_004412 [Rhodosporidiobolus nylandii]